MAATRGEYLSEVFPEFQAILDPFKGHPFAGLNQMGYGRRIPTDYKIKINSRLYRVYCCCFSNAGTCYIDTKDHKFLVLLDGDLLAVRA
jgi:hypothetical protein